jgi:hypothetical protein
MPVADVSDDEVRRNLFGEHQKQAWTDIQSSTDAYDQALISLSSGVLGLSLAFIKDIVKLDKAVWLGFLYTSWVAFVLCVLITVISFRLSVAAQNKQLKYLEKYYLERRDEFFNKRSGYSKALTWLTWLAGAFFVTGLGATVIFCIENVARVK